MQKKHVVILGAILCLLPVPAHADVIWPALFLETRLLSIPAIAGGLFVEWVFYGFGLGLTWKKAAIFDVSANAVSTIIGVVAIPVIGIAWEFFPGVWMYKTFGIGTFNPITWTFTYVSAVTMTTAIEWIVARQFLRSETRNGGCSFCWAQIARASALHSRASLSIPRKSKGASDGKISRRRIDRGRAKAEIQDVRR